VTDNATETRRTLGIGGYSRGRNLNNWRYFTDVYVDHVLGASHARERPDAGRLDTP
jgi:hypothetical protein